MQSAEGLDCCRNKILHFFRFTHIRLHKDGFTSLGLDLARRLDTRWIDITDYNLCAVLREAKRGGATNPGGAACYERNLATEVECIFVRRH
jgi:hypothetical protein